jgi:hypothetical protein
MFLFDYKIQNPNIYHDYKNIIFYFLEYPKHFLIKTQILTLKINAYKYC